MPTLWTERARRFACRRDVASLGASNENRARPIDVVPRSNRIARDRSHLVLICAGRTHGARSLPDLILVIANGTVERCHRSVACYVLAIDSVDASRLLSLRLVLPRSARSAGGRKISVAEFPRLTRQADRLLRILLKLSGDTIITSVAVRLATFPSNTSYAGNAVVLGHAVNGTRVENKSRAETDRAAPLNSSRVRDAHVFNRVTSTVCGVRFGVGDFVRHRWIGEGHRVDQAKVAQVHVVPSAGLVFDAINEGLFKVGRRVAWLTRGGWTRNKM